MPVKKTAAKKAAPAKKTAAKKAPAKSAAPALSKKVTAAKTKKSASAAPANDTDAFIGRMCAAIINGDLDGYLEKLDDALTARVNKHAADKAAATSKGKSAKKVSAAPKRTVTEPEEEAAPAELKEGGTYAIKSAKKDLNGAKVKFHRFKVDDESKAVVELIDDRPGYPKGKRIAISTKSLLAVAAKKTAAKKTTKK